MKRFLIVSLLLWSSHGFAGEFLVKYKNTQGFSSIQNMAGQQSGFQVVDHNVIASLVKVIVNDDNKAKILAKLYSQPNVEYIVPNFKLRAFTAPVSGRENKKTGSHRMQQSAAVNLQQQWAIVKVQAEKAWARAGNRGRKDVIVAVIDTGADYKHESLAPNMVPGYNFKDNNSDPMDITGEQNPGHGTHCSGIVGATGLIERGTIGIAPNISIMPLRFLDENGSGDLDNAVKAIDYAISKGVQVISASWGASVSRATAQPLLEAMKRADDKGIIFVSAAANDGQNNDTTEVYPANNGLPNAITVAASDASDAKPSWSNYGTATVHLASPGDAILSTLPGNQYGELSGTSMATPLVSGLVALLKSQDSSLTGAQIRALLQTTGVKVPIQTACQCRIDAFAAVDAVLSNKMIVVPAAATVDPKETVNLSVLHGKPPFKFVSSDSSIVKVSSEGSVTGIGQGKASITVTDASGRSTSTLDIHVGKEAAPQPTPDPDPNDGSSQSCPVGDASLCQILCQMQPTLPFCK